MKTKHRLWTLTAALLVLLLALTGIAHAKFIPFIEPLDGDWGGLDDPFVVEQGQYFSGIFGRLAEPGDMDVLAFTFARAAYDMDNALLVPVCGDHFVDFYPAVAIIGPGLDRPDAEMLAGLPFELPSDLADLLADLPPDMGALIFPYEHPTSDLLTSSSAAQTTARNTVRPASDWQLYEQGHYAEHAFVVDIPQAGEYLFAIWSPAADAALKDEAPGATGAYTFMTGAIHPESGTSAPHNLDTAFRMVDDGSWIGWDCEAPAGTQVK